MTSYTIQSIDDNGNADVDITIGNRSYSQTLALPTNPSEAKSKLDSYVEDYAKSLVDQEKQLVKDTTVTLLAPLIGKAQTVTLDPTTNDYVAANFVDVATVI